MGSDSHLTPREVIRDFIELLDIACQNPDLDIATLLRDEGAVGAGAPGTGGAGGAPGPDAPFAEFTI